MAGVRKDHHPVQVKIQPKEDSAESRASSEGDGGHSGEPSFAQTDRIDIWLFHDATDAGVLMPSGDDSSPPQQGPHPPTAILPQRAGASAGGERVEFYDIVTPYNHKGLATAFRQPNGTSRASKG
jgi:hypothetical protein